MHKHPISFLPPSPGFLQQTSQAKCFKYTETEGRLANFIFEKLEHLGSVRYYKRLRQWTERLSRRLIIEHAYVIKENIEMGVLENWYEGEKGLVLKTFGWRILGVFKKIVGKNRFRVTRNGFASARVCNSKWSQCWCKEQNSIWRKCGRAQVHPSWQTMEHWGGVQE